MAINYLCPMHPEIREAHPAKCPKCGMNLVPEDARFPFLRHMLGSPWHIAAMVGVMLALMAAAMMLTR